MNVLTGTNWIMLQKFQHGAFCQPVLRYDRFESQFSFTHGQVKYFYTATCTEDFLYRAGSSGYNSLDVLRESTRELCFYTKTEVESNSLTMWSCTLIFKYLSISILGDLTLFIHFIKGKSCTFYALVLTVYHCTIIFQLTAKKKTGNKVSERCVTCIKLSPAGL